jgi:soluble lytic murein transglycosylase-like protein
VKRAEKVVLLILAAIALFVFITPRIVDMYRKTVAKKVVGLWKSLADKYAAAWGVSSEVILAIICQESSGNPEAQNPSDPSKGLMQLTPGALSDFNKATGKDYSFDDMFIPYKNIETGTWYYATRLKKTQDQHTALAAYNAGLGNIPAGLAYAASVESYLNYVKESYGSV